MKNPKVFDLTKVIVGDVETDALFGYTKVHCCVFNELDGTEYVFEEPTKRPRVANELKEFLHEYTSLAGHNFIGFDYRALNHLLPGIIPEHLGIIDTLVISRLVNYPRKGGHSMEKIGEGFGVKKEGVDIKDWSTLLR